MSDKEREEHKRMLESIKRWEESASGCLDSMREMADSLSELANTMNEAMEAQYKASGYALGGSNKGMDLWFEFEQYTTVN